MNAQLDQNNVLRINPTTQKSELRALDFRDLKIFLQQELLRRCRFNPSYSLRAMARAIGLNHSTLSQIIRGKRPLTEKSVIKICQGLGLSSEETTNFMQSLVENQTQFGSKTVSVQQLSMDAYHVLADWYHLAILKLPKMTDFSNQPKWIAKKLGLSLNELNAAMERLKRLELITVSATGEWMVRGDKESESMAMAPSAAIATSEDLQVMAEQKSRKQMLDLAMSSLMKNTPGPGDHRFVTLALSKEKLAVAKEIVDECLSKLKQLNNTNDKADDLIQFTASLFPLTH